LNPHALSGH